VRIRLLLARFSIHHRNSARDRSNPIPPTHYETVKIRLKGVVVKKATNCGYSNRSAP